MKRKRNKKIWPSPKGIWTPDFWTSSRSQFEFWWRLDQQSSWFLKNLNFTYKNIKSIIKNISDFVAFSQYASNFTKNFQNLLYIACYVVICRVPAYFSDKSIPCDQI